MRLKQILGCGEKEIKCGFERQRFLLCLQAKVGYSSPTVSLEVHSSPNLVIFFFPKLALWMHQDSKCNIFVAMVLIKLKQGCGFLSTFCLHTAEDNRLCNYCWGLPNQRKTFRLSPISVMSKVKNLYIGAIIKPEYISSSIDKATLSPGDTWLSVPTHIL